MYISLLSISLYQYIHSKCSLWFVTGVPFGEKKVSEFHSEMSVIKRILNGLL